MRQQAEACAAFFRERPAFRRIMAALRRKYRSYGRPAGTVCLPDASEEECQAARSFFGRSFSPPLRFKTAEFEAAIQQSVFQGASLKEVLECYFDGEIKTKRQIQAHRGGQLSVLLAQAGETAEGQAGRLWLRALGERQEHGYSMFAREAQRDPEAAARGLRQACRGMDLLEQDPGGLIRLAVLSAQATGDPHALDAGDLGGNLFLHLLAHHAGQDYPGSAEQRDALYFAHGILCDSISSTLSQVGLILNTADGEHPGYAQFRRRHEICTLTLASLSGLTGVRSPSGRAYLVENEMVFTQLCDRAARFHSPLLCTSGQPSVAALRVLDLLAAEGTRLFYSGDFDGKGLSIAAQLCARYPGLLEPWHMGPEDYLRCPSQVELSPSSTALLPGCAGTPLEETAEAVERRGLAGYQELLLPLLEADLTQTP